MHRAAFPLALALTCLVLGTRTDAQLLEDDSLDPYTARSPSGANALHVDPSRRDGGGPATYRFTHADAEVWAGERPWTLFEAEVTDEGLVAGYAYAAGIQGGPDDALTIVLLDPGGKARLEERSERTGFRSDLGTPSVNVQGLFVDRDNDRLVVRTVGDWNSEESWWVYALSSGAPGPRLAPRAWLPRDERLLRVPEARPVPGTGLTLLRWEWFDWQAHQIGPVFTLHEPDGTLRWRLDWRTDHWDALDQTRNRIQSEVRRQGVILGTEAPGRFTLHRFATDEAVPFEVERVTGAREGIEVREGTPVTLVASVEPAPVALVEVDRPVAVEPLGTIQLAESAAPPPIHDVQAFALDGTGRLGAVCRSDPRFEFVLVDPEGRVQRTIDLPRAPPESWWQYELAWVGGERWVLTGSNGDATQSRAWWLDGATGAVHPIEPFAGPTIRSLAGTGDGGFVVLGTTSHASGYFTNDLVAYAADGSRRWALGGDQGDPRDLSTLFAPQAVAVTGEGRIAVLDNIRKCVQLFTPAGEFLSAVDLEQAWGREPSYPAGIRADRDGGWVVHDFSGTPSVVRMDREGRPTGGFEPHFGDGRTFRLRGDVQRSPDGTLWTSDGHALLALDEEGTVQRALGAAPEADVLGAVARLALGPDDRLHAADRRTGAVHVFDRSGARLHVCRPAPDDFSEELSSTSLAVNDAGEVFLASFDSPAGVRFDASGTRRGSAGPAGQEFSEWYAQPGTGRVWAVGYRELALIEPGGRTVARIERAPDGSWLKDLGEAAVGPDGTLAVLASDDLFSAESRLLVFGPTGAPLRVVELPANVWKIAPIAFDGRRVVFSRRDPGTKTSSLALLDLERRTCARLDLAPTSETSTPFFAAGGRELWIFDGARRVDRVRIE